MQFASKGSDDGMRNKEQPKGQGWTWNNNNIFKPIIKEVEIKTCYCYAYCVTEFAKQKTNPGK